MKPKPKLELKWCSHKAAEYACKRWHYSGMMPRTRIIKTGVWEGGKFIGCILFSWGSCQNLMRPYGLTMTEGCELTRIAMREHQAPISRMISISIRMLRETSPGLRLIVSFADPYHEHLGIIYQASNWIFVGESAESDVYKDDNGKIWHSRNVSESGKVKYGNRIAPALKPSELEKIHLPGKYRYLYPLDKKMRKMILPRSLPYPKILSGDSVLAETSGIHPEKGGSIPTSPLQI